ncbi:MAG TPA: right-handed parallel beta-helix repeat-containing protein [Planctomycetota bacterium]|nr:right-handed parallel beta-helix repeat-containing protein [Planctomycetota bacterium]
MMSAALDAADFASPRSTTAGIQEAVNALPAGGGTVRVPPGRHLLRRSIELRSGVRIRGEGPATVLARPREAVIALAGPSHGASRSVRLRHVRGLRVGDEIYLGDDECEGWWASHCIVTAIRGRELGLEVLHGERKYRFLTERHAFAANWFPAFWLRCVRDVTIADLTIDGGIPRPRREKCDFVVAAIHSRRAENLRVLNVNVRNWPGDGIGVQGGRGALVSGCTVENCAGHGFHPGTGLTESVWADNFGRGNTRDGLFFCLRVSHTTVRGSVFTGNGGHGIGGLSDPDMYNVVAANVCADNGGHGIDADRAVGAVIQGNICRSNSRRAPGEFAGISLTDHRGCVVTGNLCLDDQAVPTQTRGIAESAPAGLNVTANNR